MGARCFCSNPNSYAHTCNVAEVAKPARRKGVAPVETEGKDADDGDNEEGKVAEVVEGKSDDQNVESKEDKEADVDEEKEGFEEEDEAKNSTK